MDLELATAREMAEELERRGLSGVIGVWDPTDGRRGLVRSIGDPAAAAGIAALVVSNADAFLRRRFDPVEGFPESEG